MALKEAMNSVKPANQALRQQAKQRWDQVAKPLGSPGVLEEDTIHVAAASGSLAVSPCLRAIVVMCGDNDVVKEEVTQTGQEVTVIVAGNIARGNSRVCLMVRQAGADVIPMNVGMAYRGVVPGMVNRKVAYGTKDFLEEPTMIMEEIVRVIEAGADTAMELEERGYVLTGSGEMGIGNTTTSSAPLSVLLNMDSGLVTGRGAGPTIVGYNREVQVIREDIRTRKPSGEDPVDVLSKVGGLDLAILTGFYAGCAACGLPVVLDGFITGAAALAAVGINPDAKGYLLVSHVSAKPVGAMVLSAFGLKPTISAGICLGEGTGAATLLPLLDMAVAVHTQMNSSDDIHVDAYEYLL